ncbi:MAG: hypothetical protein ACKERG_00095 [Candidatus Hodgkinia cicadicola]
MPAEIAGVKSTNLVTPFAKLTNRRPFAAYAAICSVTCIYTLWWCTDGSRVSSELQRRCWVARTPLAAKTLLVTAQIGTGRRPSKLFLTIDRSANTNMQKLG